MAETRRRPPSCVTVEQLDMFSLVQADRSSLPQRDGAAVMNYPPDVRLMRRLC